jgi:mandelate racemase
MATPHRTASGTVSECPLVLVDAITDQGITGYGITFTYTALALKPVADLIHNLAALVEGEPLAPANLHQRLNDRFRLLGTQGMVGMAIAAIDMALWDALARVQSLPLYALLGGQAKPIPAYGAVGYDGELASAQAAENWAKQGFRAVKAKIGYSSVAEDRSVLRAIRSAVGPDIHIMVDYNQALLPAQAIERLQRLDGEDLAWIEEPTLAHDYEGHARISAAIKTPIQCGENWWGPLDMRHAIAANASDYIMLDVMKIGGVTGWMRAAALGAAHAIPLSSHLWPELSTHLLCVTPTAHWLEYADWWNPILLEPLTLTVGAATPDHRPGSGMEWNEDHVAQYLA